MSYAKLIHAKGTVCKSKHESETIYREKITCRMCKLKLATDKEFYEQYEAIRTKKDEEDKARLKALDNTYMEKDLRCPKCFRRMSLRQNKTTQTYFFGCSGFPMCKQVLPYSKENQAKFSKIK